MAKEDNKDFGLRIRYAMSMKGLRNKDIVARCKDNGIVIHPSTVSQYLAGRFAPTDERVELMASVLGVDKLWLQGYGGIEDMTAQFNESELKKALSHINSIFSLLPPDLQRQMLDYAEYLYETSIRNERYFKYNKNDKFPFAKERNIRKTRK